MVSLSMMLAGARGVSGKSGFARRAYLAKYVIRVYTRISRIKKIREGGQRIYAYIRWALACFSLLKKEEL